MVQQVYIDLRGQKYTQTDKTDIEKRIVEKSNNIIQLDNIKFLEDE